MNKVWFTSDTHFGEERTLQLSKRPFKTVEEMDRVMTENWNNVVGKNDVVYHLGDFGRYEHAKHLNGKIILLVGNYERDDIKGNKVSIDQLYSYFHKVVNDRYTWYEDDKLTCVMVHEPSNRLTRFFTLFGHIHKLQMVKQNALNVGVDCHNFTPIDLDTVLFYKNAIQNHYDREVFLR